ncbi:DNA cytosine methyltransferase [Pseudomonas syringae pv. actinidifoliorum]|uniref:DNA cytosine methyltransferase n=1 Tax=Pseudomonas syringae TaxID=317 RepID=UPI001EED48DD|nr:DNA cytosine methyltransferase [Pseudomonas syringae]MDU8429894.1 DNA cytosine methyltransferase [Pseudomonas syringae pv. actinidifoliorum]MBL3831040.1 DNA cytosine methyltransferase [Pseudomonas syringae pv. theae]MBL3834173.1 DNA cytosine methyltransferase [Pseudomonas syringae pv. theae]MBL3866253.1 DNA cytosine methyltransferase [Pseudomonas syringae pv. theae]MDU8519371.1 DNA cytosine methyltransferase [Pseudomonas syringae pv. actinidifoliorum]
MRKLPAVSLFSNCGAGDVGYRDAGFNFEVMAELDPRRLEVCLLNHPKAKGVSGDLRTTWSSVVNNYKQKAGNVRPALLSACPPCQGMSSARSGKGSHSDAAAGSKDERNLLVTVIAKVALELKPSLIVVENVPAFFTRRVNHPTDQCPVSAANYLISALAADYVPFPIITNLCDFGVPQSRNRAFITFVRRDVPELDRMFALERMPFPKATHGVGARNALPVSIMDALSKFSLPDLDAGSKQTASASEYLGFHTVPVWDERIYSMVSAIPKFTGRSAWENDKCNVCGPVDVSLQAVVCPVCSAPLPRPIILENGKFRLVKGFKSSYRRMHASRPAATVTTASGHIGSDYTIHPIQNRLLSPIECALLQTFPLDFKWGEALEKWGHSNVREMIGEAVPPAFTKMHGKVLRAILEQKLHRAVMTHSDLRCRKGWENLTNIAKKDFRENPKTYFKIAVPESRFTLKATQASMEKKFVQLV